MTTTPVPLAERVRALARVLAPNGGPREWGVLEGCADELLAIAADLERVAGEMRRVGALVYFTGIREPLPGDRPHPASGTADKYTVQAWADTLARAK